MIAGRFCWVLAGAAALVGSWASNSTAQEQKGAAGSSPQNQLGRNLMKAVVIGESSGASREAIMAVYPRHKAVVDKFIARGVVLGIGPFTQAMRDCRQDERRELRIHDEAHERRRQREKRYD